jgi:hypothetical protein
VRAELLHLDVEDVARLRTGDPPPGARAVDVVALGALLVTLTSSVQTLRTVVSAVRGWLARGGGTDRTVRLEVDGDVLELSGATPADQQRLVDLFVARHAV